MKLLSSRLLALMFSPIFLLVFVVPMTAQTYTLGEDQPCIQEKVLSGSSGKVNANCPEENNIFEINPDQYVTITLGSGSQFSITTGPLEDFNATDLSYIAFNANQYCNFYSTATSLGIVGTVDLRDQGRQNSSVNQTAYYFLQNCENEGDFITFTVDAYGVWTLYANQDFQTCDAPDACPVLEPEDDVAFANICAGDCDGGAPSAGKLQQVEANISDSIMLTDLIQQTADHSGIFKPLCSHDGKIKEVLLMDLVTKGNTFEDILKKYDGIFSKFDSEVRFYLLINFESSHLEMTQVKRSIGELRSVKEYLKKPPLLIRPIDYCALLESGLINRNSSIPCRNNALINTDPWAQDPIAIMETALGNPVLLSPLQFNSFSDYFLAEEVSAATHCLTSTAPFEFDSGNQLGGSDFMIMGADAILAAGNSMFGVDDPADWPSWGSPADIMPLFKNVFGVKEIIWVGDTTLKTANSASSLYPGGYYQPIFHLDMFLTLGGKVMHEGEERELIFLGNPKIANPDSLSFPDKEFKLLKAQLNELNGQLTNTTINGRKTKVERIPMPVLINNRANSAKVVGSILSLNNCQIEVLGNGEKRVFLPSYTDHPYPGSPNLSVLYEKAKDRFRKEGFTVVMVPGPFAETAIFDNGSLHCLTKVLRRDTLQTTEK